MSPAALASAGRRAGLRSLRFRLTVIVAALFLVAMVGAGLVTRDYLRTSLEQDARLAATSLLDDFLAPSDRIVPAVDAEEITRILYLDDDGAPIPAEKIGELLGQQVEALLPDALDGAEILVSGSGPQPVDGARMVARSGGAGAAVIVEGPPVGGLGPNGSEGDAGAVGGSDPSSESSASIDAVSFSLFTEIGAIREIDVDGAVAVGRDARLGSEAVTVVVASPTSTIDDSIATVTRFGAVGIPILTAVVAAMTWFVTARTLRPVEAIRRQVELTDPSHLDHHVPQPGTGDEIDRLAGTMNDMLDRLHASSTRQRRFISDASHELRSPITATLATLEATDRCEVGDRWPELLSTITGEQRRLQGLVDDLLLLAELDERSSDLVTEGTVDLDELVLGEVDRPRAVAVRAHVDRPHRVAGNPRLLGRAVSNLVDNAARHASTSVDVTVTTGDDGGAIVRVDDDGPGIPAADRERILDRFTRLDEARRPRDGGAGLGLAIVREIVGRHGGTLVVGESPTGGARFEIICPLRGEPAAPAPVLSTSSYPTNP